MYEITHTSGDVAEAETIAAARVAAKTLIEDNDDSGVSTILSSAGQKLGAIWRNVARGGWSGWGAAVGRDA